MKLVQREGIQGVILSPADMAKIVDYHAKYPGDDFTVWLPIDENPTSAVRHVGVSDSGIGKDATQRG